MPPDDGRNSPPVCSLEGTTGEEWQNNEALSRRLFHFGKRRKKAFVNSEYIAAQAKNHSAADPLAEQFRNTAHRIAKCASWLEWRFYFARDDARLRRAVICGKHLLCPNCASLRGLKMAASYLARVGAVLDEAPHVRPYMVTVTVRNGENLEERFDHLTHSWKVLRKRAGRGNAPTVWDRIEGAAWSVEVKRGRGSGLWHPHIHCVALCDGEITTQELSRQWRDITGDSNRVDVRPIVGSDKGAYLEVFKYALKFSDMDAQDNFHAWRVLHGRRLIASSGCLFGIDLNPEDLMDPQLDDPRFYDLLFRFAGDGYQLSGITPGGAGEGDPPA